MSLNNPLGLDSKIFCYVHVNPGHCNLRQKLLRIGNTVQCITLLHAYHISTVEPKFSQGESLKFLPTLIGENFLSENFFSRVHT